MKLKGGVSFKQFLISYIIVLFIPLLISVYAYLQSTSIIEKKSIEANMFTLTKFQELFDKQIESINYSLWELNENSGVSFVSKLTNPKIKKDNMYWFHEFFDYFRTFSLQNYPNNIPTFLFIEKNNAVYSYRYLNLDMKDTYSEYIYYHGLTYDEWHDLYFKNSYYRTFLPEQKMCIASNKEGRYITYLSDLPLSYGEAGVSSYGVIAYFIDMDSLEELMSNSMKEQGGATFILDSSNNIMSSSGAEIELPFEQLMQGGDSKGYSYLSVADEKMIAMYSVSEYTGLAFLSVMPLDAINKEINTLQDIVIMVIIITLFIGISIAISFSYFNFKPIKGLVNDNSALQQHVNEQKQALQVVYLDKLLNNSFIDIDEMHSTLNYLQLDMPDASYVVVLVRIFESEAVKNAHIMDEQEVLRVVIKDLLILHSGSKGLVHILDPNEMVLILSESEEEEVNRIVSFVQKDFFAMYSFSPLFSIGNIYPSISEIHLSFSEARYGADRKNTYSGSSESMIMWYKDIQTPILNYSYTTEAEQIIINMAKAGKNEELSNYLDILYVNFIENKKMSYIMQVLFLNDMHATVVKLIDDLKFDLDLKDIERNMSIGNPRAYFDSIKEIYIRICKKINCGRKSRSKQLNENILNYIHENFSDSNLSVALLAENFNLSETYFSQFFKEQTNETFSKYLENLRIQNACKLLKETDKSVDEIAVLSGYNSANTFRRAFKRVMGVSPSEFLNRK